MAMISELKHMPELAVTSGRSLEELINEMLTDYSAIYRDLTGSVLSLSDADPEVMALRVTALQLYQLEQYIEHASRQNFLPTAEGAALDSLGAMKRVFRRSAQPATVTVRFSMVDARTEATGIPGGTRLVTEDGTVFVTDEYAEIPAGSFNITASATAEQPGESGNGYQPGSIDTMMDPVPYIDDVTSITASAGGADVESDEEFTREIYNAPLGYSVAGPEEAYEVLAKAMRSDIADVKAYSPDPACVNLTFTLAGGEVPSSEDLSAMEAYFTPKSMRPLADRVTAEAPTEKEYTISLKYYIRKSDSADIMLRKSAIEAAINQYKAWQRTLGRDINPSELIRLVMAAGAKRVELTSPAYAAVSEKEIAKLTTETVTYGGVEDD